MLAICVGTWSFVINYACCPFFHADYNLHRYTETHTRMREVKG